MEFINKEILNLWAEATISETNGLMPLLYNELKKDAILFIGLNPSFSGRGFKIVLKGSSYEKIDIRKFYAHPNNGSFNIQESIEIETLALEKYSYFKKFHEISKDVDLDMNHIDLFFIRGTSQKMIKGILFDKGECLSEFAQKQIKISKRIIEKANPKIIVVANALASRIFIKIYGSELDKKTGCYFIKLNDDKIPVLPTSMLMGQRALDNYSFERLKWHIKKIANKE